MTDQYIVGNKIIRSKRGGERFLQWAKKVVRDLDRAVFRIAPLYDLYLDDNDKVRMICRFQKGSKKGRKKMYISPVFKYGIEVPNNPEHATKLEEKNGNTFCQDAIYKDIKLILDMYCFEFHPDGYHTELQQG